MADSLLGIHHVTAIADDPQRNVDFYMDVLGLRLVKRTVNYDDPGTYHLYYGDEVGHPGTILTFFPWPGAPRGRRGSGQATVTSFSVPWGSLGYWADRFKALGVRSETPQPRFDEEALVFFDPDGLMLELVAHPRTEKGSPWTGGPVPPESAVRGLHGITLTEHASEPTASLLVGTLGFRPVGTAGPRSRLESGPGGPGTWVDVLNDPAASPGHVAVGTVHHVAWRTPTDEAQQVWRQRIIDQGVSVTPMRDRQYFHSIYFREPGGVLFEIATDPPGFTIDEAPDKLGMSLRLPPWLESMRGVLEERLPPIKIRVTRKTAPHAHTGGILE
jgi:glyoxalase family protein